MKGTPIMTYRKDEYEKNKKKHSQATNEYMKNNLERITIRLPKEKKDDRPTKAEIDAHCKKYGYGGIQPFIIRAIQTQIAIDNGLYDKPLASILDSAQNDE